MAREARLFLVCNKHVSFSEAVKRRKLVKHVQSCVFCILRQAATVFLGSYLIAQLVCYAQFFLSSAERVQANVEKATSCTRITRDAIRDVVGMKSHWRFKDEGHYRIDGEILKNELQKWNQHPRKT